MGDKPVLKAVRAWSYSRYADWKECPFKLKCKLDKVPEPPNYAMERGNVIHKRGEHYLLGTIKQVPQEFSQFKKDMLFLKKNNARPEMDLAVTARWGPTAYNDWNRVWARAKADAVVPPTVELNSVLGIDYKTGKKYASHEAQAELMGLFSFSHFPGIDDAEEEMWYLDSGERDTWTFTKKEVPKLRKKWEANVKPMFAETTFKPKPGNHCGRCGFGRSKGGPCPEG